MIIGLNLLASIDSGEEAQKQALWNRSEGLSVPFPSLYLPDTG
jgi:hypothetical protein